MLVHSARELNPSFRRNIQSAQPRADVQDADESILSQGLAWISDRRKLAFLAQVGVGTIDQALMTVLPAKHQCIGLMALSRRVSVIDEVHAYDAFTSELLHSLPHFHASLGGSAILLSATLPSTAKAFLDGRESTGGFLTRSGAYPLVTRFSGNAQLEEVPIASDAAHAPSKRVQVRLVHRETDVLDEVRSAVEAGGAVAWVRNTVDDAMEAYRLLLREGLNPTRTHLFHARMAMGDRVVLEDKVKGWFGNQSGKSERKGRVLVATQVIEQSLDLDFDRMFSDLAPIDLLLQRAGRLYRHLRDNVGCCQGEIGAVDSRPTSAELTVLSPTPEQNAGAKWYASLFPRAAWVYQRHGLLWLTAKLLSERGGWDPATDPRSLVEAVYAPDVPSDVPDALREASRRAESRDNSDKSKGRNRVLNLLTGYGGNFSAHWTASEFRETRLGLPTTRLRLAIWEDGRLSPLCVLADSPSDNEHAWELSQIQLPAWRVDHVPNPDDSALKRVLEDLLARLPDGGRYAPVLPLVPDGRGNFVGQVMDGQGKGRILSYSRDMGMEFPGT